ncbi:MAG TPA: PDZ domain-containing protein [Thermoflexia bacterium]|nr:PDZ domain-containing protein [Thermoflexia bacterium]
MNDKVNGWKILALVLIAWGILLSCCFSGTFFGGLIGYALGQRMSITQNYGAMRPETPWIPDPDAAPEGQPFTLPTEDDAWLGVAYEMTGEGAEILQVLADTPAEEAGLERGDVVVKVDDLAVTEFTPLGDIILSHEPGDEIELLVLRDGEELEISVRLGHRPSNMSLEEQFQLPPIPGEG